MTIFDCVSRCLGLWSVCINRLVNLLGLKTSLLVRESGHGTGKQKANTQDRDLLVVHCGVDHGSETCLYSRVLDCQVEILFENESVMTDEVKTLR